MDKKQQASYILTELINTNTVNPDGNELNLVKKILEILDINEDLYTILYHGDNRASLVIDVKGTEKETISFWGHLDTVPIADASLWNTDPLKATFKGNIVYGRGTTDMKGGLTAMLMLCKEVLKNKQSVSTRFIFTADEELGGIGISAIKENSYLDDIDYAVIAEPSGLEVGVCEKGAIWIKLMVTGKSSHAANPSHGVNALEYSFEIFKEIKEQIKKTFSSHRYLGEVSCSATISKSGVSVNIIPDYAELFIDIRSVPVVKNANKIIGKTIEKVINTYNKKNNILNAVAKITQNKPAIESTENNKLYNSLKDIYKKENREFKKIGINFFTDVAIGLNDTDIPFVILGAGEITQCHTTNEHININDVVKAFEIYLQLVKSI
ncbi:MAG: ArgE/DapE family deacylase [Clostridia bacterium]